MISPRTKKEDPRKKMMGMLLAENVRIVIYEARKRRASQFLVYLELSLSRTCVVIDSSRTIDIRREWKFR